MYNEMFNSVSVDAVILRRIFDDAKLDAVTLSKPRHDEYMATCGDMSGEQLAAHIVNALNQVPCIVGTWFDAESYVTVDEHDHIRDMSTYGDVQALYTFYVCTREVARDETWSQFVDDVYTGINIYVVNIDGKTQCTVFFGDNC